MIASIILAAGQSSRLGTPKALLLYNNKTFLKALSDSYSQVNINSLYVVLSEPHASLIIAEEHSPHVHFILNPEPGSQMITSIQHAIKSLPYDCEATFIQPVDMPLIEPAVISALKTAFERFHPLAVLPSFNNRIGHPVLVSASLFPRILALSSSDTLRSIIYNLGDDAVTLSFETTSIRRDIDTPEDYQRLLAEERNE